VTRNLGVKTRNLGWCSDWYCGRGGAVTPRTTKPPPWQGFRTRAG